MSIRSTITIDLDTAGAVADALSYYLLASSENFGQGYGDEDTEDARQLLYERGLVAEFAERVDKALKRLAVNA